jgi:hypothetical protein
VIDHSKETLAYLKRRDESTCTRTAKSTGYRCGQPRQAWPAETGLPDPESCRWHLAEDEAAAWDEHYRQIRAASPVIFMPLMSSGVFSADDMDAMSRRFHDRDPACWSWPAPETCTFRDEDTARMFLSWWNQMCATCGSENTLVEDHDHRTGLVRGMLCRSCNIREGKSDSGVFRKYRERNPASILGIQVQYWSPWTGFAEPEPETTSAQEGAMRDAVDTIIGPGMSRID